jgi:hypothetical protein
MRSILFVLVSVMIVFSLQAQIRDQVRDRIHDHVLYQDGKVFQVRDQVQLQLREQLKLQDGTLVGLDGSYRNALGEQFRLREGECLDFDGNLYASQDQFRRQLQTRALAMNQLHYLYQDGNVYRVQGAQRTQVQKKVKLEADGKLKPNGTYRLMDQKKMQLQNGECLDPNGNLYNSQAQFRQLAQLRIQAMNQEHFVFSNGNLYRVNEQVQTQIREPMNLQNGIVLHEDGIFQLRDQQQIQLRNGECIDPDGNIYGSQEQFHQQAQLRLQAMNREHYVYQDGQLYRVQNQERIHLREPVKLQSGLVIHTDGTYRNRDQVQARLLNGECLDPEGNKYQSQEQFRQQMRTQYMAMAEPHFFYQNGYVYRTQNQVTAQIHQRWTLPNGTWINPDGSYQVSNGKKAQMKNGEYLDGDGIRYENHNRFTERMQQRVQDRMELKEREKMERKMMEPRRRVGG